jgi:hypothetical protein
MKIVRETYRLYKQKSVQFTMTTKNIIPQADGEGSIGIDGTSWASGVFNTGVFERVLVGGDNIITAQDFSTSLAQYVNKAEISIGANSNVGIGTTSPDLAKLQIEGGNDLLRLISTRDGVAGAEITLVQNSNSPADEDAHGLINFIGNDTDGSDPLAKTFSSIRSITHDAANSVGRLGLFTRNGSSFSEDLSIVKGNVGIGVTIPAAKLDIDGDISISGAIISSDSNGRVLFSDQGLMVGEAQVKPDPDNPQSIYFNSVPQVQDSEGNAVTILTADKLGLGTSASLTGIEEDIKFKLLTDQQRFVVGTTGDYGLESGWYRFNDFKVKGATDIGCHSINPVDTRIYSDESSFILFKTDTAGNRVAHLVGGDEEVSPNNAIALGIAVKVDNTEFPEDIEFVHTDGESYSVINGNSDSLGTNGLPLRQGFQPPSLGSSPSPLLIDGGSF